MELTADQMARIEKGAALLDERMPDWHNSDFGRLDINCFRSCILCKVYGGLFWDGADLLFGTKGSEYHGGSEAAQHGFYPHEEDANENEEVAAELNKAKVDYWMKQINQRREK